MSDSVAAPVSVSVNERTCVLKTRCHCAGTRTGRVDFGSIEYRLDGVDGAAAGEQAGAWRKVDDQLDASWQAVTVQEAFTRIGQMGVST